MSKVASRGFTPGVRDIGALVQLLAKGDDETVLRAMRALAKIGELAEPKLIAAAKEAEPKLRARPDPRDRAPRGRVGGGARVRVRALEDPDPEDAAQRHVGAREGRARSAR